MLGMVENTSRSMHFFKSGVFFKQILLEFISNREKRQKQLESVYLFAFFDLFSPNSKKNLT